MSYTVKSQTPLMLGENFIYPLTTADQVVVGAGTENERRLEVGGKVEADHAVNAENAVKADNADNALLLGGKEPKYYIQPRNLLDNSDFRNPVNQRGANSYTGGYSIDRWRTWASDTLAITGEGITVSGNLYQYLEPSTIKNAVHTFATMKSDGTVLVYTANPHSDFSSGADGLGLGRDTSSGAMSCMLQSGVYVWAALYEGEYTADNLPPYIPKGYGAELMECMRYFQRIIGYDYSILSNGFWFTSTSFRTAMPISFPMRSKPAISMDLSRFQVVSSGATQLAPLKVDLVNQSGSTVSLSIETASNTQGLAGMLRASVSSQYSYIDLSADL